MRPKHITASVALAILASGCATTRYAAKLPDVSTNCVADLRQIAAVPLQHVAPDADPPAAVEFASVARCIRSGETGAVPVALYRLEGVSPPSELNVSVVLSTGGTFAAAVEVLDTNLQPLQQYGFERFTRRGNQYSLSVFLNPSERAPGYLLLKPDRAQVGKTDVALGSASSPVVIPAGPVIFTYHAGSETSVQRPFLEGGQVLVTARPQTAAPFSGD